MLGEGTGWVRAGTLVAGFVAFALENGAGDGCMLLHPKSSVLAPILLSVRPAENACIDVAGHAPALQALLPATFWLINLIRG